MFSKAILLLVAAMAAQGFADDLYHMSDEFIDKINADATTWRAARNFPKDTKQEFLNSLTCSWLDETVSSNNETVIRPYDGKSLPEDFDARTKWNTCTSLNEITEQGGCGSCWAVAASTVISDRQCIQKGVKFHASAEDIVSCCHKCGYGCHGGWPYKAFEYFCKVGVVSGGSYHTKRGCKPYSKKIFKGITPRCVRKCTNRFYGKTYFKDLHRGSKAYTLHGEKQIKQDLYENGPIAVTFIVYEDFVHYNTGVYQHQYGNYLGAHAVRLIGWGVENGTPYWLLANSWGAYWGDEGTFKFLRGINHCNIESSLVATVMVK